MPVATVRCSNSNFVGLSINSKLTSKKSIKPTRISKRTAWFAIAQTAWRRCCRTAKFPNWVIDVRSPCAATGEHAADFKGQTNLFVCFWYRLDQQRERLVEAGGAGRLASVVPQAHHHQIVRGDDQRRLAAGTRHVVSIGGHRISSIAVQPKEGPIDRSFVRRPGGRKRADELGIALWEHAFTVPDTIRQKQVAKPRPVAPGANLIALT